MTTALTAVRRNCLAKVSNNGEKILKFLTETHNPTNSSVNEYSLNICRLVTVAYTSFLSSLIISNVKAAVSVRCGCER